MLLFAFVGGTCYWFQRCWHRLSRLQIAGQGQAASDDDDDEEEEEEEEEGDEGGEGDSVGAADVAEDDNGWGADEALNPDAWKETPDGGCLCYVLRTGFSSSQVWGGGMSGVPRDVPAFGEMYVFGVHARWMTDHD